MSIAAGAAHSVAVREDGLVLTTGLNDYGQLGCTEEALRQGYRTGFAPIPAPRLPLKQRRPSKGKREAVEVGTTRSDNAPDGHPHVTQSEVGMLTCLLYTSPSPRD